MNRAQPTDADPADAGDGRAARKARTRSNLRHTAQQLFAAHGFERVTTAEIAAAASVSVQTLFNHFATKEELFFDGRAPWVDGPADAVRSRTPYEPPLAALTQYLTGFVGDRVRFETSPEGREYASAVASTPALGAHERELLHEAEERLRIALEGALREGGARDPVIAAALISAASLGAARVLIASHRQCRDADGVPSATIAESLEHVVRGLATVAEPAPTFRWPVRESGWTDRRGRQPFGTAGAGSQPTPGQLASLTWQRTR
jgi:AcrR family transcriptional regulator